MQPSVTLLQLGVNVVTDWIPGVPNSLASGFSTLLGEMLKAEKLDADDFWTAHQQMTGFEKQWKQVTSWILGVAFARRVIEELGYPWWAPVSAFSSKRRATLTPSWTTLDLPPNKCVVEKDNSSKLYPDYALARLNPSGSGYQISFAESKGCEKALERLTTPPPEWKKQSRNAKFKFDGVPQSVTQYLLIATRICPDRKITRKRRIQVRAWNSMVPEEQVKFAAFRDVVVTHYFGVCERIGLSANAQLLALRNYSPVQAEDQTQRQLLLLTEGLLGTTPQEARREQVGDMTIYFGPRASTFRVGDTAIRIGLTEPAMKLVSSLQQPQQFMDERMLHRFESEIAEAGRHFIADDNVFVRNDGVIGISEG